MSDRKNAILVRSRDGVFFEIPVDLAPQFALPASEIRSALEHFDEDISGHSQESVGQSVWAKMSW